MGLEGRMWKRKSIDGEWIKNNETKDIKYSINSQKDSYDYLADIDISLEELYEKKVPLIGSFAERKTRESNENEHILFDLKAEAEKYKDRLIHSRNLLRSRPKWDASDLGKYTINTPTPEKHKVEEQDEKMIPISEKDFKEISDDIDVEDANFQNRLEKSELSK